MARNDLFDTMKALNPAYLLRFNEAGGTDNAIDHSGNGYNFTYTAGADTPSTVEDGPFFTGKNDAATNKVRAFGKSYFKRTGTSGLAGTNAAMATTGVTLLMWIKPVYKGYVSMFDGRNTSQQNGLAVVGVAKHEGGVGIAQTKMSVIATDAAGASSILDFTGPIDGGGNAWDDGKWHLCAVRFRSNTASGGQVDDEVFDVLWDANLMRPTYAARNVASGTFSDPATTNYHSIGAFYGASQNALGSSVGPVGFYSRLLTDEEILAVYHAGTRTVGDAASGLASLGFGGFYADGDAEMMVNEDDFVTAWTDDETSVSLTNSAGDTTNPLRLNDTKGRLGAFLDGVAQGAGGPNVTMNTANGEVSAFPTRVSLFACCTPTASSIRGAAKLTVASIRNTAESAGVGLCVDFDQVCLNSNTTPRTTDPDDADYGYDPDFPCINSAPSPTVLGVSIGNASFLDYTLYSNGRSKTVTLPAIGQPGTWGGNYYTQLTGKLGIGRAAYLSSNFVSAMMHAVLAAPRPLHPIEAANLTRFWGSKYKIDDAMDGLVEVWGNSLSSGLPNTGVLSNNNLWQNKLPLRVQVRNASIGGQQSGLLFNINDGTAFSNNSNSFGYLNAGSKLNRRMDRRCWNASSAANPMVEGSHIAVYEQFNNDMLQAAPAVEDAGNVGNQCIQNYINWRAARLAVAPGLKIIVVLPEATWGATANSAVYSTIVDWFLIHPEMYDTLVRPVGLSSWIHPEVDDYPKLGTQINAAVTALLPAGANSTRRRIVNNSRTREAEVVHPAIENASQASVPVSIALAGRSIREAVEAVGAGVVFVDVGETGSARPTHLSLGMYMGNDGTEGATAPLAAYGVRSAGDSIVLEKLVDVVSTFGTLSGDVSVARMLGDVLGDSATAAAATGTDLLIDNGGEAVAGTARPAMARITLPGDYLGVALVGAANDEEEPTYIVARRIWE